MKENRCEYCGKKLDYEPFTCKFCGHKFCSEHRLPENHECKGLEEWKKRKEKPLEYERMREEKIDFSQEWKPFSFLDNLSNLLTRNQRVGSKTSPGRTKRLIYGLLIGAIVLGILFLII